MLTTSAQTFQAFSLLHGFVLLVCFAVVVAVVRLGLKAKAKGPEAERTVARVIAAVGLVAWFVQQGYDLGLNTYGGTSVPLHICDLAGIVGPIALLSRRPTLRTVLYFWAFALTIWGLLTPTLGRGPGHLTFWLFWINHGGVMVYASYDCVVRGYRPTLRDVGLICLITMAYVAVVTPLNLAYGWNYGYLGNAPVSAKTPLDVLPAWPYRILAIEALGAFLFLHVWAPWGILAWRRRQPRVAGA